MKWQSWVWALLAFCFMGCLPALRPDARVPGTSVPTARPATSTAPPPVTANQVTRENAHAMSQALWDEMDRLEQNDLLVDSKSSPKKK